MSDPIIAPLAARAADKKGQWLYNTDTGDVIALAIMGGGCTSEANAEHIVRCVNAHEALVAEVREHRRLWEVVVIAMRAAVRGEPLSLPNLGRSDTICQAVDALGVLDAEGE